MNKKGFTLVELLAVIIILSILSLLIGISVTKLVSDSKKELSDVQMQLIQSAADAWSADNLSKLPDNGKCIYITLQDLKDYGLIASNVIDPEFNKEISGDLKIKITSVATMQGKSNIKFEINPDSTSDCLNIYS